MSILTTLYRVASTHHWIGARLAYRRGDYGKALEHFSRISAQAAPRPRHKAFHATLLSGDRRPAEARVLYQEVIDEIGSIAAPTENDRYVLNYCRYYVALIDNADAEGFRTAAAETSPESYMHRLLPLPPLGWKPGTASA